MLRVSLPFFALAVLCFANGLDAQQTKDPTDVLFEEILGEAIKPKQDLQSQPTEMAKPFRQVRSVPVVQDVHWGSAQIVDSPPQVNNGAFVEPTFRVPTQQVSSSFSTPHVPTASPNSRKSVVGSVAMELIAPRNVNLNQTATIRVQLQNTGADDLKNLKFIATLPEHARFEAARPQPSFHENGKVEFSGIRMAARSNNFIEIDVVPTTKAPLSIGTQIQYTNQEDIAINVRQPELDVQVSGPQRMILGESESYTIKVTNIGDGIANNLVLTSELPEGLTKLRATNATIESLGPGKSAQIQIFAQALKSGTKDVQFNLASAELEPVIRRASTAVVQPELEVSATGPSINFLQRNGVYQIEVNNPGQVDCSNVNIELNIPQEMAVSTISRQAQYNESSRQLSWNFKQIPAGQNEIIQFKAKCVEEGQHSASIFVDSDQTVEKEFRISTMVATRADVSISISNDNGPIQIGAATVFEIVVENKGSRVATDVEILVELPVSVAPGVSEDYVVDQYENTIQFSAADVGPGETKTYSFKAVGSAQGEQVVRSRLRMSGSEREIIAEDSVYIYEADQSKVGQRLVPQIRR